MFAFLIKPFLDANIRKTLSVISLFSAIALAIIAMLTPPMAIIDASVLWFTSQMLVFISGLLGVNLTIDFGKRRLETKVKTSSDNESQTGPANDPATNTDK
jgi:hypothetical protein